MTAPVRKMLTESDKLKYARDGAVVTSDHRFSASWLMFGRNLDPTPEKLFIKKTVRYGTGTATRTDEGRQHCYAQEECPFRGAEEPVEAIQLQ